MFTELRLQGFKGWADTGPIRFARITAFLGANSSGKSSILQSLLLMKQTTESADRRRVFDLGGDRSYTDLGTFADILHRHEKSGRLALGVSWETPEPIRIADQDARSRRKKSVQSESRRLALHSEIRIEGNDARVTRMSYRLGEILVEMVEREKDEREGGGPRFDLHGRSESGDFEFLRSQGRPWGLPGPARFYGFPDEVRRYYQNASWLSDLELAFEEQCERIRYLGPLRDDPPRQYVFSGAEPQDVGRRGELAVDALVVAERDGRKISRGFSVGTGSPSERKRRRLAGKSVQLVVAEWLKELGLIHSFRVEVLDDRDTLYTVKVKRNEESAEVLLTDVGFGVSQVLPVLTLLAVAKPRDVVVLEQPEIHLHPSVQAVLADIVVETALARDVQIVVETHSEHFLTRLQRRIAERDVSRGLRIEPDDVALYFTADEGGTGRLRKLELDLFGNITNWPENFFGDLMSDAVIMMDRAAARSRERV